MSRLIQIIGPPGCGKSTLRSSLAPGAFCANKMLISGEAINASAFYVDVEPDRLMLENLRDLVEGSRRLWIYEGLNPIWFNPTFIWKLEKIEWNW